MDKIDEILPAEARTALKSRSIRPTQADIVDSTISQLTDGNNVSVVLPIGLEEVLVSPVVVLTLFRRDVQTRPKTLIIVPTDSAVEHYVDNSPWLEKYCDINYWGKTAPRSSLNTQRLLDTTDILVTSAHNIADGLKRNHIGFKQLDDFALAIFDEYADINQSDRFREETQDLVASLKERKPRILYITASEDISGKPVPLWDEFSGAYQIVTKSKSRRSRRRVPIQLAPYVFRSQNRDDARDPGSFHLPSIISIRGLERFFWMCLAIGLLALDLRVAPLGLIVARVTYFLNDLLPVVVAATVVLMCIWAILNIVIWITMLVSRRNASDDDPADGKGAVAEDPDAGYWIGQSPIFRALRRRRPEGAGYSTIPSGDKDDDEEDDEAADLETDEDELGSLTQSITVQGLDTAGTNTEASTATSAATVYRHGDDQFDEDFSINNLAGEFVGECGCSIAGRLGADAPARVTALSLWAFDKNDYQSTTKVLTTDYVWSNLDTRKKLSERGDPVLATEAEVVVLLTTTLKIEVGVSDLSFSTDAYPANRYFLNTKLTFSAHHREQSFQQ